MFYFLANPSCRFFVSWRASESSPLCYSMFFMEFWEGGGGILARWSVSYAQIIISQNEVIASGRCIASMSTIWHDNYVDMKLLSRRGDLINMYITAARPVPIYVL